MKLLRLIVLVDGDTPGQSLTAILEDGASELGYDIDTYEVKDSAGECRYYKIRES